MFRNAPEAPHRGRFLLTARAMGRTVGREPEGEAAAAALPELGLGLCGRSEFDNRHGFFVPPWRMAERGGSPRESPDRRGQGCRGFGESGVNGAVGSEEPASDGVLKKTTALPGFGFTFGRAGPSRGLEAQRFPASNHTQCRKFPAQVNCRPQLDSPGSGNANGAA